MFPVEHLRFFLWINFTLSLDEIESAARCLPFHRFVFSYKESEIVIRVNYTIFFTNHQIGRDDKIVVGYK